MDYIMMIFTITTHPTSQTPHQANFAFCVSGQAGQKSDISHKPHNLLRAESILTLKSRAESNRPSYSESTIKKAHIETKYGAEHASR